MTESLRMAFQRRTVSQGLIVHSDQGLQYSGADYRRLLHANAARASMSRKGNCWDNAVVESFFDSLKKELVHHCRFPTRQQARNRIFEYIEVFYNRTRLHSTLGYLSPMTLNDGLYEPKISTLFLGGTPRRTWLD